MLHLLRHPVLLPLLLLAMAAPAQTAVSTGRQPGPAVPVEICANGLDDDGDGYLDCFDPDCACFTNPDCTAEPPGGIEGRLAWRSGTKRLPTGAVPLVANLNPQTDQIPEIVSIMYNPAFNPVAYAIYIYRGDGANADQPDSIYLERRIHASSLWVTHPVIGDLDADGRPELVLVNFEDGKVEVYRNYTPGASPAMQRWVVSDSGVEVLSYNGRTKRPQLADFNGDGIAEIFAGNAIFQLDLSNPANPLLKRVLKGNGPDGKFHDGIINSDIYTSLAAADMLSVADCNGDPDCEGLELVAGNAIYAVDLETDDGDGFQLKIVRNLNQLAPLYSWGDGYTAVADIDLDGTPDVVVISRRTFSFVEEWGIYIWDKKGLKHFLSFPNRNGIGFPSIVNVFDDRKKGFAKDFPEIFTETEDRLTCFNLNAATLNPNKPWWWSMPVDSSSGAGACTVFDFNADGASEIVYRDRSHLRILYGGPAPFPPGVDNERNWWKTPTGTFIGEGFPVVADVDNDGQAEIAMTGLDGPYSNQSGNNTINYLRVYESAAAPWAPCRPLWNQFNYNALNIGDDLRVPAIQQPHWLEFPGPGGGKYPYNNQFTQQAQMDGQFQAVYPVPDAVVTLDSSYCSGSTLYLALRVCNQGSAFLPAGTPLQFYRSDPTATAAAPHGAPFLLSQNIRMDSCASWNVQLPLPPAGGALWGLLNDNGSMSAPFNLSSDFPVTFLQECDYLNNLFSLNLAAAAAAPDLGPDKSLCPGDATTLRAGPGFAGYRWQDGSADSTFTATKPGKYWVDAWDACGNKWTDTLLVLAGTVPTAAYTLSFYPGHSVVIGTQVFTEPGTVTLTKPAPAGCDSLITYTLVHIPTSVAFQCPPNRAVTVAVGAASAPVPYDLPAATTDCPGGAVQYALLQGLPSGGDFPLGATTVCYEAANACGIRDTCCFTVTVAPADLPCDIKTPAGCLRFELLDVRMDALGQRHYRIRIANACASPLLYACIQLPDGLRAAEPADGAIFEAQGGNLYTVRNPNAAPFHSIRFRAAYGALNNGAGEVFEFSLPQQADPDYMRVYARLADGAAAEAHLNTFSCPVQSWPRTPAPAIDMQSVPRRDGVAWPNPTRGRLLLDLSAWQEQSVRIYMLTAQGYAAFDCILEARPGWQTLDLPGNLPNGLYYLFIQSAEAGKTAVKVVLER